MEIVESIRAITSPNAPLMQPAHPSRQMEGRASAFIIKVRPGAKAFRYDVNVELQWMKDGQEYNKSLAKGTDEGLRSRNRNLCYDLLAKAHDIHPFLPDGGEIVYDNKASLYTSSPINPEVLQNEIVFPTAGTTAYVEQYVPHRSTAKVVIRQTVGEGELHLDDFGQYTSCRTIHQEDRSVRTFLEMAVAQYGINQYHFTPIGAGKLFEVLNENRTEREIDNGMVLRKGISKGVRIVKGTDGKPTPALVVDSKVSPFFKDQSLEATIKKINSFRDNFPDNQRIWDEVANKLQDVRVEVNYDRSRTFGIRGFTQMSETANNIRVRYNGALITVNEYFLNRDEMPTALYFPDLPLVIPHYVDQLKEQHPQTYKQHPDYYFPIELLLIMPDQRVPLEKMSNRLSQELLTANSLRPEQRYATVINHCELLNLFPGGVEPNPVLQAFGLTIQRDSNKCQINVRLPPRIVFRGGVPVNIDVAKAEWKRQSEGKHYFSVEPISNWVILCHEDHSRDVKEFASRFQVAAQRRGMVFADQPNIITFGKNSNWGKLFEEFAQRDVQFVILVDPKNFDTHGILKYYEVRMKILTQHITYERVKDVLGHPRGRQTLENILNKTNLKYSGVNYHPVFNDQTLSRFKLESNDVLIIGYDIAQPPPMSAMERRACMNVNKNLLSFDPAVIGITANMGADPHNFVGDYYFQEAYRDGLNYNQLTAKFSWVLQMLNGFRPGARPKYIFVIRNGLSEGQFAESVKREMEALRNGCNAFDPEYQPKFAYILGTKRHFKKYYAGQDNNIQNMVPGSVVDSKFVREDCPEFFMQSHFALKGVGKPVEYNILVDEIGVTKDEIEDFLNSLCYSHQIVNSAVSMPEPVYQADELAKRGRNNYTTMKRLESNLIPRYEPHNLVDVDALNAMLTYHDNPIFVGTRFTA